MPNALGRRVAAGTRPGAEDATEAAGDEAALVARARNDPLAFAPLYARYLDPVHRYCYRRLGTREAAEDATSLVFVKALAGLPTYRGGPFRSWLFAIAHNVLVDRIRAPHLDAPLEAAADLVDPAPATEDLAVAADRQRALRQALSHLPEEQRRVVELRLAGLTGPEIARALGRSHDAVRAAQLRALTRLRMLLAVGDEPEEAHDA